MQLSNVEPCTWFQLNLKHFFFKAPQKKYFACFLAIVSIFFFASHTLMWFNVKFHTLCICPGVYPCSFPNRDVHAHTKNRACFSQGKYHVHQDTFITLLRCREILQGIPMINEMLPAGSLSMTQTAQRGCHCMSAFIHCLVCPGTLKRSTSP